MLFPNDTFRALSIATAKRDHDAFERPDEFDITNAPFDNPQLTFGSGVHDCLGAALARAELHEALAITTQRLFDLRLAGEIVWRPGTVGIFGPEHLPVSFGRTPRR